MPGIYFSGRAQPPDQRTLNFLRLKLLLNRTLQIDFRLLLSNLLFQTLICLSKYIFRQMKIHPLHFQYLTQIPHPLAAATAVLPVKYLVEVVALIEIGDGGHFVAHVAFGCYQHLVD